MVADGLRDVKCKMFESTDHEGGITMLVSYFHNSLSQQAESSEP